MNTNDNPITINELFHTLNELLGEPYCIADCEHGGGCSLENGHEGDHEVWGSQGIIHTFPNPTA